MYSKSILLLTLLASQMAFAKFTSYTRSTDDLNKDVLCIKDTETKKEVCSEPFEIGSTSRQAINMMNGLSMESKGIPIKFLPKDGFSGPNFLTTNKQTSCGDSVRYEQYYKQIEERLHKINADNSCQTQTGQSQGDSPASGSR